MAGVKPAAADVDERVVPEPGIRAGVRHDQGPIGRCRNIAVRQGSGNCSREQVCLDAIPKLGAVEKCHNSQVDPEFCLRFVGDYPQRLRTPFSSVLDERAGTRPLPRLGSDGLFGGTVGPFVSERDRVEGEKGGVSSRCPITASVTLFSLSAWVAAIPPRKEPNMRMDPIGGIPVTRF